MVNIRFLGSLSIVAGVNTIEVDVVSGDTVGMVIEKAMGLLNKAELKRRVLPEDGGLRVTLMLNSRSCGVTEKVQDNDEIYILSPIGGG